jgi:hypothetical protein
LNIAVFHSGIYRAVTLVESFTGNVTGRLAVLKDVEKSQDQKVIALVGDSTTEEGLGARDLSVSLGKPVVNLALPGTSPNEWFYFLRSIDPDRNRFDVIVLMITPHNMRSRPHEDGVQTLIGVAPIDEMLRYAWEFDKPSEKMEYVYATFDRIFGHRHDLAHLFFSPKRIVSIREEKSQQLEKLKDWPGENFNVCRVGFDPATGKVSNWGEIRDPETRRLSENALRRTAELNRRPVVSGLLEPLGDIIKYYDNSTTKLVILSIPFGLRHVIRPRVAAIRSYYEAMEEFNRLHHVSHLDAVNEPLFKDCRNYYDFRHLNERGRKLLSAFLAKELQKDFS